MRRPVPSDKDGSWPSGAAAGTGLGASTPKRKKKQGFTLFELLVVLVVISLMTAMVIPRLSGYLSGLELKTAAKHTAALLRYARNKAATEKVVVSSVLDLANRQFIVYRWPGFEAADGKRPQDEQEAPRRFDTRYSLPEGIDFLVDEKNATASPDSTATILFFPNGSCSGGTVTLGNEVGKLFRLQIDPITGGVGISG